MEIMHHNIIYSNCHTCFQTTRRSTCNKYVLSSLTMERNQLRCGRTILLFFTATSIGLFLSYTEIGLTSFSFANLTSVRSIRHSEDDQKWKVILEFERSSNTVTSLPTKDEYVSKSESPSGRSFPEEINKSSLLNITNFKFLSDYSSLCNDYTRKEESSDPQKSDKLLLIIIQTSRKNFNERKVVRKTWGSVQPDPSWSVRFLFLMGVDPNNQYETPHDDPVLDIELSEFGDLVIGNFLDTWKNSSYKSLSGLKWVLDYCQSADFVFITSDNIFVNVDQIIKYREEDLAETPPPNLYCGLTRSQVPIRCADCDYFVDTDAFPAAVYPDYCSGIGYGLTVDLIRNLYSVSNQVRFVWISDVFTTGILMEAAKAEFGEDMEVVLRELWTNDITLNVREEEFVKYCNEDGKNESTKYFKTLVSVPRGIEFENYMMCLLHNNLLNKD
ncbi:unnamed protein product [Orchesella dallaii]|uniref:Hexosyltransferase n=1 Tax=Orchesella dallaii TaxID=48710 RepID=A0ABP1S197_9HEXA